MSVLGQGQFFLSRKGHLWPLLQSTFEIGQSLVEALNC
ncbi:hypothetical protein J699_02766 [Acinetobacter sp. 1000160]|nr:hypothetical protein J699_02766 [Acinetobacter sp. 1000160]